MSHARAWTFPAQREGGNRRSGHTDVLNGIAWDVSPPPFGAFLLWRRVPVGTVHSVSAVAAAADNLSSRCSLKTGSPRHRFSVPNVHNNHFQECLVKQSLWQLNRVKSRAAVQAEGGRLWMTGKKWARLFQVKIKKLPEVRTATVQLSALWRGLCHGSAPAHSTGLPAAGMHQAHALTECGFAQAKQTAEEVARARARCIRPM